MFKCICINLELVNTEMTLTLQVFTLNVGFLFSWWVGQIFFSSSTKKYFLIIIKKNKQKTVKLILFFSFWWNSLSISLSDIQRSTQEKLVFKESDNLDKTKHIKNLINPQSFQDSNAWFSFIKDALGLRANHILL